MNLGGLHCICVKVIHKDRIIDSYRRHTCRDQRWMAWKSCLGVVFGAKDEACHVVNTGLILQQVSSFPCNQLLTSFFWILPAGNVYISRRIQLFTHLIKYLVGCQWCRIVFILLLRDNISNNSCFRQKHPGVPDCSDGSDRTSYPLTENYTLPIAQVTGRVA